MAKPTQFGPMPLSGLAATVGLLALSLLAAEATSRPAGSPATTPASRAATQPFDANAVAELIRLLGHDNFRVREEATKKLTGMGDAAHSLLEAKLEEKNLDAEVAARINTVLNSSSYAFDANEAARRQEEAAKALGVPNESNLDLGTKVSMKLALIPPGTFMMGSPNGERERCDDENQHRVTIGKAFYMGIYHVTRGQFAAFVADSTYKTDAERDGWAETYNGRQFEKVKGASWMKPGFDQTDEHPVVSVSHNDALAFCDWLKKKTGRKARLPTEAEWEYSCRAGTTTAYQWGDKPNDGKGWCNALDETATSPVGKFKANSFGLYDMHGNAFQWCGDWFDENYYATSPKVNPQGPATGTWQIIRGGCWYNSL